MDRPCRSVLFLAGREVQCLRAKTYRAARAFGGSFRSAILAQCGRFRSRQGDGRIVHAGPGVVVVEICLNVATRYIARARALPGLMILVLILLAMGLLLVLSRGAA